MNGKLLTVLLLFYKMKNLTTILFPDISGFTDFVNNTEIEHGQRIIVALLEEIIKSNKQNFVVSEIEGDSILFYKNDKTLEISDLLELTVKIYKDFHKRRKEIDSSTHCNCGACTSINKLTLKFIIHTGEVKSIKIFNFEKLYGLDVIIAHRLLKNNIEGNEYVLITSKHVNNIHEIKIPTGLIGPKPFRQHYDNIGTIEGHYFKFSSVINEITKETVHRNPH